MSSTERNKVKSFGDPSIAHGEMADRFLIVGAFNAPPLLQIGLIVPAMTQGNKAKRL